MADLIVVGHDRQGATLVPKLTNLVLGNGTGWRLTVFPNELTVLLMVKSDEFFIFL